MNKDIEDHQLPGWLMRFKADMELKFEEELPLKIRAEILRGRGEREAKLEELIEAQLRADFAKRLSELIDAKLEGAA